MATQPPAGPFFTQVPPVVTWAVLGAIAYMFMLIAWGGWIISGDAVTNTRGRDQVPADVVACVWGFQIVSLIVAILAVVYSYRSSKREGRLSFDAILCIAWSMAYWLDPLINYIRPQFYYNTYFVNFGTWANWFPGWISPNGALLPEPVLFTGSLYVWFMFTAIAYCAAMRWAKNRWPRQSSLSLMMWGFLALAIFDLILEYPFVRYQIWAFPGAIHSLSLHGGTPYQFPLYEAVFASLNWGVVGALRYFRDDRGQSWVERGIEKLRLSVRMQSWVRLLAVTGFVNIACLVCYALPFSLISLHIDKVPDGFPLYMSAGICGEGTSAACPDPRLPMSLPNAVVPPSSAR